MVVCSRHREKTRASGAADRSRGPTLPGLAGEERRGEAGRKTPLLNLLGRSPEEAGLPSAVSGQICGHILLSNTFKGKCTQSLRPKEKL